VFSVGLAPLKRVLAAIAVACSTGVLGCAAFAPRPAHVTAEHLDPLQAFTVLKESPRTYKVRVGSLRRYRVSAPFVGQEPVQVYDLPAELGELWDEATSEALYGNPHRSAQMLEAIVNAEPACAECRHEYARVLINLANKEKLTKERAHELRYRALDEMTIAGVLDRECPSGAGAFYPPTSAGRTDIPLLPRTRQAGELFAAGNDAFNSGEFTQARSLYGVVVQREPTFGRGYVGLGDVFVELGAYQEAAEYFTRALSVDSTDFLAWRSLAECAFASGNAELAKEAAVRAVVNNYHDTESWRLLGNIGNASGFSVHRRRIPKRVEINEIAGRSVEIVLDSLAEPSSRAAWFAYAAVRSVWRYEGRFAGRFPRARNYFPTYDEEVEALASLISVWRATIADSAAADVQADADLEALSRIAEEGYLNEYVLFEELCADNPNTVRSFSPALLLRIREYISRYVIGGLSA